MKKAILFDNDGVLVETEPLYYRANLEILQRHGLHISDERYKEVMIKGLSAFVIMEEEGYSAEAVEAARDARNLLYQHYIRTEPIDIPGAKEVVAALAKQYRMGIVTSARREDFELIHRSRPIMAHMEFALCSREYPRSKPYPDPYLLGLERLGVRKEEALIVEDSKRGLDAAVAAGIECVVVANSFTSNHDLSTATYRIETITALIGLLDAC